MQKIGKFCNYQNLKDAYSFLSGDKILCSFYFDSYSSLGHLISRTLAINVIGYTNNSRVSFANRVSKLKKKQESLLQALIKRDMLLVDCDVLYKNFCERNQFLFCIKMLSKFSVQILRDMGLLFVKTVVVIIKSTEVLLNTLHKCIVIACREGREGTSLYRL